MTTGHSAFRRDNCLSHSSALSRVRPAAKNAVMMSFGKRIASTDTQLTHRYSTPTESVAMRIGLIGLVLVVLIVALLMKNVAIGGVGGLILLILIVLLVMGRI